MTRLKVIVALGALAWDGALRALAALGHTVKPRPRFGHLAEARVGPFVLLGCYHPSQQNTFTGKLTEAMLDQVFERARELDDQLALVLVVVRSPGDPPMQSAEARHPIELEDEEGEHRPEDRGEVEADPRR